MIEKKPGSERWRRHRPSQKDNSLAVGIEDLDAPQTTAWGNAGAASTRAIASGDCYVEFTATETNTYRMAGLSNGDANQDWQEIDFALYPNAVGNLEVYEAGTHRGVFGAYAAGDQLR